MAGSLDHPGLIVIAVGAVTLLRAVSGTGGCLGHIPCAIAVAGGAATVSNGVRGVAAGTLGSLGAVLGTGCVLVTDIIHEIVTQRGNMSVHIGVAAVLAHMGGVAFFGTGRRRDSAGVAVNQHGDHTGLVRITAGAIPALFALCLQSSCFRHIPIAIAVTGGAATGSTGVRGVAAGTLGSLGTVLGTGCVLVTDIVHEVMAQGIHMGIRIAVIATGAGMGGVAPLSTGGGSDHRLIVVAQCRTYVRDRLFFSAKRANTRLSAISSTSSIMIRGVLSRKGMCGILPAAADYTGVGCIAAIAFRGFCAVFLAGGITIADIFGKGMAQRIHIGVHKAVAAIGAGMGGITLFSTGGGSHNGLIVMAGGRQSLRLHSGLGGSVGLESLSAGITDIVHQVAGIEAVGVLGLHLGLAAVAAGNRYGTLGGLSAVGSGGGDDRGAGLDRGNLAAGIHSCNSGITGGEGHILVGGIGRGNGGGKNSALPFRQRQGGLIQLHTGDRYHLGHHFHAAILDVEMHVFFIGIEHIVRFVGNGNGIGAHLGRFRHSEG